MYKIYARPKHNLVFVGKLLESCEYRKKYILPLIVMTIMLLKLSFFFVDDPCHHYSNLSEGNRNTEPKKTQPGKVLCDNQLQEGWYRFVAAAGTKMPTTRVPAFSCGTHWPGWLKTAHPTEDGEEVHGIVCFSNRPQMTPVCKKSITISIKNCGSYFIYKLHDTQGCNLRYCGTD